MKNKIIFLSFLNLAIALSSCSYNQTQFDKIHRQALEIAKKNQTIDIQYPENEEVPLVTSKEISPGYNALIQNKTITNSSTGKLDSNFNISQ